MSSILDRLGKELEAIGKRAQTALDEGRLQLELLCLRRQQDTAARDLGLLFHARERGQEVDQRRVDTLLVKLDDLSEAIARQERAIAATRGEKVSVKEQPAPAGTAAAEAEILPSTESSSAPPPPAS